MDSLLFPVKLTLEVRQMFVLFAGAGLCAALAAGCGYRSVLAPANSLELSVQLGQVLVPETTAAQEVASGARSELAAAGKLGSGAGARRLLLDVLRVDELSRGIHVQSGAPRAGAMSVAVTVRGRILSGDGQEPSFDSGDMRRAVQLAGDDDPTADSAAYELALRQAAERAGRAVARAALGIPEPADETP